MMGNLSRSRRRVFKRLAKDIGQDIWLVRREVMPGDSRYGVSERKEYKKIKKLEGFLGISTAKIPIEESQPLNIGNQTVTVSSRQFQTSDLTSDSLILVDNRLYHCQLERTIIRQGVVTEYVLKLLQAQEYRILA